MGRCIGWCFALFLFTCNTVYGIDALPGRAVFYRPQADTLSPYMELYWQIDPNTVTFKKDEKEIWTAHITTVLEVSNDTGVLVSQKYYLRTTPAASLLAAQLQNIMDLQRFSVTPGKVRIKLTLFQDGESIPPFEYIDSIEIDPARTLFYSSVQLLDTFYATGTENMFVKNKYFQIPQCLNFLDDYRTHMHYYTELYRADELAKKDGPYVQHVYVSRKEFDYPIAGTASADTVLRRGIMPVMGTVKIKALPSGNYYLNFILKNAKGSELAKKSLFFQRSNTNPVAEEDSTEADSTRPLFEKVNVFDLSTTFVGKYTIAQLKAIMKMLKPIATEAELVNINGFAKRPEETYMRYFVYNFWKSRMPADPAKGWEEYTDQVRQVNKMFGSKYRAGYETDRGFYLLKYGPPDQRDIITQEQGALPYEVWQYNAPGKQSSPGAFLFYNPGFMVDDYKLLHSTVQGEMRNTNWRAELYNTGASVNNNNSRAEQVFMYNR